MPVAIPADAIIVPYDPEKAGERAAAEKILVPYAKYVELWNQAHPDKRIDATAPPVGYAIAGTTYEAMLASGDFLSLTGHMAIDVYSDKPVAVPLQLTGGVLERVTVDGEPARLQLVEPQIAAVGNALRGVPDAAKEPSVAKSGAAAVGPAAQRPFPTGDIPPRLLLLHLSGKGRKTVELQCVWACTRQGGGESFAASFPSVQPPP